MPGDVLIASPSGRLLALAQGGGLALVRDDGVDLLLPCSPSAVSAVSFSACDSFVASVSDDKSVRVWRTNDSSQAWASAVSPRKPSAVEFAKDADGQSLLLVGGKTGDVVAYRLPAADGKPTFLLGHTASMLTGMVVACSGTVLITADRDEKIRVSQFPQTSRILAFCLGHRAFVSRMLIPENAPDLLLSSGGDGAVRLWAYSSGQPLGAQVVGPASPADAVGNSPAQEAGSAVVADIAYSSFPPSAFVSGCVAAIVEGVAEVSLLLLKRPLPGDAAEGKELCCSLETLGRIPLLEPATAVVFVGKNLLLVLLESHVVRAFRVSDDGSTAAANGEAVAERITLAVERLAKSESAGATEGGTIEGGHNSTKGGKAVNESESGGLRKKKIRRMNRHGEGREAD